MTARWSVVWSDGAREDLLDITEYVARHEGVGTADALRERIVRAVRGPESMPRRCRAVPELEAEGIVGYRELLVGPYRAAFALRDRDVVVLTVVDGRRDLVELLVERALRRGWTR